MEILSLSCHTHTHNDVYSLQGTSCCPVRLDLDLYSSCKILTPLLGLIY